jgi:predicted phage-related endonuclease
MKVDDYLARSGGRLACPHPVHRVATVKNSPARIILPECAGQAPWLAARLGGIGGSEVGALVGVSEYETPFSVWNTKKHGGKDLSALAAVEWGHRLEEVVAAKTADNLGLVSRFAGGLWADRERDFLRVTPDRFACKPRSWKAEALIECKGLPLGTPVPVPSGWSSIEAIQPGDQLFAADGTACRVTGKSEIRWVDCYRLTFDDGTSIVCDADHRWPVVSGDSRRPESQVLDTRQIAESLVGKNGQKQHRILLAGALDLPDQSLPVEPYTLGCWLGDGSAASGRITKPDQEMFDHITAASGLEVAPVPADNGKCPTRTVYGLVGQLRMAGVLDDKHIPAQYLRASRKQRMALLQGLMDSDGTSAPTRKQVVFSSAHKQMALDFEELALSLGERPVMVEVNGTGFGKPVTSWRVQWRPTKFNPFRLSRKAEKTQIDSHSSRSGRRMIVSAEPTMTVPTQCLMVDSADHTYLCDRTFLPTHNTAGDDEYWADGVIYPRGVSAKSISTGSAPLGYQAQCQWQMGIIGLPVAYLGCLVLGRERQFFTVEIHFDEDWFTEMANEAERFWHENVLADEPPMHNLRHPKTEELLKELHPDVIRPSVQLPEDAAEWLRDFEAAKDAVKKAEQRLDEIKNYFRMETGDAGAGYLGEQKIVSYPEVPSTRIDVTALKEQEPALAERFTVKSHYRRLTIRSPKGLKA